MKSVKLFYLTLFNIFWFNF